jgi:hypothetical protein
MPGMTTSSHLVRRALLTTGALVASGLTAVAFAPPVQAASVPLTYHCTTDNILLPTADLSAVVDTNAPATLGAGMTVPITVTSDVTVPDSVADQLRGGGVASVQGSSVAAGTVDGAPRSSTLAIPRTTLPADGDAHVVGTGGGGTITGGAVGSSILLGAGDFTAKLTAYNSVGTVMVPEINFTCVLTPPTGQTLVVDTVNVVQTTTTTALTVAGPVEYGAVPKANVKVTQSGSSAKPSGSVALTYAGKTITVMVKGGKAKTDLPPALTMGANKVTAVFTPTDKDKAPSQTTVTFTVVRGPTTSIASATYRDGRHRLVGKALVTSDNGTDVAGRVKLTVKRNGTKIRTAIVGLNAKDRARKIFANIRKPGTYVVVTKYLGSPTLKRSTGRVKLTVV